MIYLILIYKNWQIQTKILFIHKYAKNTINAIKNAKNSPEKLLFLIPIASSNSFTGLHCNKTKSIHPEMTIINVFNKVSLE